LVAKTLEYEGDLTQAQIADATLLPARTVRYALTKLEANDLVTSRISFVDARKRIYSLGVDDTRGEESDT
jgi:DNA-binding MarR family transcriptional regulator